MTWQLELVGLNEPVPPVCVQAPSAREALTRWGRTLPPDGCSRLVKVGRSGWSVCRSCDLRVWVQCLSTNVDSPG